MTAHELAKLLLEGPDLPVYRASYEMNGDDPIPMAQLVEGVRVLDVCPVPGERGMAYKVWPISLDMSKRRVVFLP